MRLGHEGGVTFVPFPQADPALLVEETVTCVIQIKGKVRDRVEVPAAIGEDELRSLALARDKVVAATARRRPDGDRAGAEAGQRGAGLRLRRPLGADGRR